MLTEHRALVRRSVGDHGGHEVGTQGDGFLVQFSTPADGVSSAIDLQRAMAVNRERGAFTPEVRIGVHTGEAVTTDNDLVGRVINLAARVTSVAGPSEIVVTEPVADHLTPGFTLVDRGLVSLKGVNQPRHLLAIDWRVARAHDRIDVDRVTDGDEGGGPD